MKQTLFSDHTEQYRSSVESTYQELLLELSCDGRFSVIRRPVALTFTRHRELHLSRHTFVSHLRIWML